MNVLNRKDSFKSIQLCKRRSTIPPNTFLKVLGFDPGSNSIKFAQRVDSTLYYLLLYYYTARLGDWFLIIYFGFAFSSEAQLTSVVGLEAWQT